MEGLSQYVLGTPMFIGLLVAYHLLFFWKVYSQPFSVARSELLSTFFPSWVHLGRGEKHDGYYWGNYCAHPVLSSYYPIHWISSRIANKLCSLEEKFRLLIYVVLGHHAWGSIGWFILINHWSNEWVALFGSITLSYSAYNIKQQPCIAYTIGWFPWLLLGITKGSLLLSSLSFGMILLAGYYPVGLQVFILACLISVMPGWSPAPPFLWWVPLGLILGLPQVLPFIKYLPKTIRANKHDDIGKVPWWHFVSVFKPNRTSLNGVGYWEMQYYCGILVPILALFSTSRVWPLLLMSASLMMGFMAAHLPRIPARWSFTFQFALGWMAVSGFNNCCIDSKLWLSMIVLQAFDLYWNNSKLLVTEPYSELPQRPSWAFNTPLTRYLEANLGDYRVSGLPYPLFTGHINRLRTLGYSGGMQLKLMAKWRGDTNPNGSGEHDWFKGHQDSELLDRYRVRFAVTSKKPDNWLPTPIRNLWRNPRV